MRTLSIFEQFDVGGGDNDGDAGEAEAKANMDGLEIKQSLFDAFCNQLGDAAGSAVGKLVGSVNPAMGAALQGLVTQGVSTCCSSGSIEACVGKTPPPPPDYSGGGGGAAGGW